MPSCRRWSKFIAVRAVGLTLVLASVGCDDSKTESPGAKPPSTLSYQVFISDPIPFDEVERAPNGDPRLTPPIATTLISGDTDAILVDPPFTNDHIDRVGKWIEGTGKRLTAIVATHGHGDHWFGTAALLQRFPNAKAYASTGTIDVMRSQADPAFRAGAWDKWFPNQIPASPIVASVPPGNSLQLEGNDVRLVEVGHSDTDKSTVVHVPSLGLIVAGDVVYNGRHQYLAESANGGLEGWIRALDVLDSLKPVHVIASHKNPALADDPKVIEETRHYLQDAQRTLANSHTRREFYDGMVKLHPNLQDSSLLWFFGAKVLFQS